jgi:CDP-diacylglycerol---glycerol-3-phosphate 3-phosphatidyltransferase
MPILEARAIPNLITLARVLLTPAVFVLALADGATALFAAFLLFAVAAVSDIWDGHLARKHGWISDFGKLMDPLADKLLLVATFVPFFIISNRPGPAGDLPYWGELPVWVLVVIFGRELLVTVVRQVAARRGRVIPAGVAGKVKAAFQNVFIGAALLWYALQAAARENQWADGLWQDWQELLHAPLVGFTLLAAIIMTVYSMLVYFWRWRQGEEQSA